MTVSVLSVLLLAFAPDTTDANPKSVELRTPDGTLAAGLDLPATRGPWPVVIVHPGSGPTDRDGNQPLLKNNSLKMLGAALAERGIACLRLDKRGVGGSAKVMKNEADLRVGDYASDVAAWAKWLRTDDRFLGVGFIGHSEGALIGALAGQSTRFDAYVSLCGPGRRLSDVLRGQLADKLPDNLAAKSEAIIKSLEAGTTIDDVPVELAGLYRPSVQPFLISLFAIDPPVLVGKLTCPVLVVTGSTDIQVPAADGAKLAARSKGAKVVVIQKMSHVLKPAAEADLPAQVKTVYVDPKIELHPDLADTLAKFLTQAMRRPD